MSHSCIQVYILNLGECQTCLSVWSFWIQLVKVCLCFGHFLLFGHSGLCPERAAMGDFWRDIAIHRVAKVMSLVCRLCKVCDYTNTMNWTWLTFWSTDSWHFRGKWELNRKQKLKPDVTKLFQDLLMDPSCTSKNEWIEECLSQKKRKKKLIRSRVDWLSPEKKGDMQS